MRFLLAPLLALCLTLNASAQVSQEDLFDTVCRITSTDGREKGYGSGFVFAEDETTSYIMTCYHVVKENGVTVQFQRDGFMSDPVPVETVYKSYAAGKRDLAILALEKKKLGGLAPKVLPLYENVNYDSSTIYTVGHAGTSLHPSMFVGTIHARTEPGLHFSPPPKSGRSGSPIVGYKPSTGQRFAIGVIGWRNEETGLGRAMDISQIYAILRGEDVALGTPISGYTGTPVQQQYCPPGQQCPPPLNRFFGNWNKPNGSAGQAINPNNPWIKTPGLVTPKDNDPLPSPPLAVSDHEKRLKLLEADMKSVNTKVDVVISTANDVKEQLQKLGVTFDSKLKDYATRDAFGNYVTRSELVTEQKNTLSEMTNGVTSIVTEKINSVESNIQNKVDTVQSEVHAKIDATSDKQSAFDARLEKVAVVAGKVAPLLNFIPGWGTLGSLGVGGIATGLYAFSRRKKKPEVVTQGTSSVYPQTPSPVQPQLDHNAVMNLVRQEMSKQAQSFVATPQTFSSQPLPSPTEINYTVAPAGNDELHFRQAMEAVSRKYPETGHAIKMIEAAYPIFKSGVR